MIIPQSRVHAQDINWNTFYPADSSFVVSFPEGEITHQIDTVSTAIGPLYYHKVMNKSSISSNQIYTVVSWTSYPEATIHSDSTALFDDFWKATMNQSKESVDGTILFSSERKVQAWPAYTWKISYDENQRIDNLGILKENTFFLLQFSAPSAIEYTEIKVDYFDSFHFMPDNR